MAVFHIRLGGEKNAPIPKMIPGKGLGDRIERLVKPIAVGLRLPCLDKQRQLKPESPCAKRRAKLNDVGAKIGIGVEKPEPKKL